MTQRDYRVLIGAAGWQHTQWGNEVFYPEDLPEDWYLSFYANEFPLVLVPESDWLEESAFKALFEEVNDQVGASFKCLFELDANNLDEAGASVALLDKLECELVGLLLRLDNKQFDNDHVRNKIIALAKQWPVCLEFKNNNENAAIEGVKTFCEQHAISLCWKGEMNSDADIVVPDAARLWVARCRSDQDKKQILQNLKTLLAGLLERESLSREHVLIIDGSPPSVEVMRNASVMLDLM